MSPNAQASLIPATASPSANGARGTGCDAPIRRQYLQIKRRFPDTILLFRLGDFYETFEEDAEISARVLDIVLTSREMGKGVRVALAGIPHHSALVPAARRPARSSGWFLPGRRWRVRVAQPLTVVP